LAVEDSPGSFTVAKLQGGYTRYLKAWNQLQPGLGASFSAGVVPEQLQPVYGNRVNVGFGVFLTLRPSAMMMMMPSGSGAAQQLAGQPMVMVQTALDPAKLSCSPKIDPKEAAKTTYQGKTYYFCSVKERDDFLTNPAMSLSMMPPKQ
jgi:YHS domain-containing protein